MINKRKKILELLMVAAMFVVFAVPVYATGGITVTPDTDTGLGSFRLPTFLDIGETRSFSIISYISLAISLIFIFIGILWVGLAIKAAFDWLRSEGNEDLIGQSKQRFTNIFASISILFGFFLVLILFSNFLGFGNILTWPKQFSFCEDGGYYFQLALEFPESDIDYDTACFQTSGAQQICQLRRNACEQDCEPTGTGVACRDDCAGDYNECISNIGNN